MIATIILVVLGVLLSQLIVFSIIIFILKKLLDGILVEAAIKKLEYIDLSSVDRVLDQVVVTTHRNLKEKYRQKISSVITKRLQRPVPIVAKRDKRIWGGMTIELKTIQIDFSLISRLRESGILR